MNDATRRTSTDSEKMPSRLRHVPTKAPSQRENTSATVSSRQPVPHTTGTPDAAPRTEPTKSEEGPRPGASPPTTRASGMQLNMMESAICAVVRSLRYTSPSLVTKWNSLRSIQAQGALEPHGMREIWIDKAQVARPCTGKHTARELGIHRSTQLDGGVAVVDGLSSPG